MSKKCDVKFGGCDFFFKMILYLYWMKKKILVLNVFTLFLTDTFRFHQVDKCFTLNQRFNTNSDVYTE